MTAHADLTARLRAAIAEALPCECHWNTVFYGHAATCVAPLQAAVLAAVAPIVAEAQRDTVRLDWLETNAYDRHWDGTIGRQSTWNARRATIQSMRGETLRAAIDAARTPEAGDE